jgi:hypothetical protein
VAVEHLNEGGGSCIVGKGFNTTEAVMGYNFGAGITVEIAYGGSIAAVELGAHVELLLAGGTVDNADNTVGSIVEARTSGGAVVGDKNYDLIVKGNGNGLAGNRLFDVAVLDVGYIFGVLDVAVFNIGAGINYGLADSFDALEPGRAAFAPATFFALFPKFVQSTHLTGGQSGKQN